MVEVVTIRPRQRPHALHSVTQPGKMRPPMEGPFQVRCVCGDTFAAQSRWDAQDAFERHVLAKGSELGAVPWRA